MILFQLVQSLPSLYALSPIDPMSCKLMTSLAVCLVATMLDRLRGKSASMVSMFSHCFHTRAMQVNRAGAKLRIH